MPTIEDLLAQGKAAIEAKHWRDAVEVFTRCLQEDKRCCAALEGRVEANIELGCRPAAIVDLNTLIRLQPENASNYEWRGFLNALQRQFSAAIADMETAFRLDPMRIVLPGRIAQLRFAEGDTAGALSDLDTALKVDPERAEEHRKLRKKILNHLAGGFTLD